MTLNYVSSLRHFLDWVIQLPADLEQQLTPVIEAESEDEKMPSVTSWERRGMVTGKLQLVLPLRKVKFGSLDENRYKLEKLAEA